jgi:hypothetical protein
MYVLLAAVVALVSILIPSANARAEATGEPPLLTLLTEDFSPMQQQWQPVTGTWSVGSGTYRANSAGPTDISTITTYPGISPDAPPSTELTSANYIVRARVRNSGTTDDQLVGFVYGFQDAQNYYEVVLSGIGSVTVRTIKNGVVVKEVPRLTFRFPTNTWVDLEIHWNSGVASMTVNGNTGFQGLQQPEFTHGQVGLVAHGAVGRFDKVSIQLPAGDQGFLELFEDQPFQTFTPQSGQWAVAGGTYNNSAVQQTSVTLAPVNHIGVQQGQTREFTFRADMLNPYAGSGNLVGIVFNYIGSAYHEVVFSPTGVAKINRFENGKLTTLATASYKGARNTPFSVTLELSPLDAAVSVDGVRIFDGFDNPEQIFEGRVGLITHWAPGHFDNIAFDHGIFRPCSFTFDNPPQAGSIVSGTWNTTGGTLNDTSAGSTDIVQFDGCGNSVGDDAGANFLLRARVLNQYGASGNLAGLVFDYQNPPSLYAGDYYEVTFSPTGVVQLNKFTEGVRYPIATGTHSVPANTWFNVEVKREEGSTSVSVNGTQVIQSALTGQLRSATVGVITHWAKARFDNVQVIDFPVRAPFGPLP